MHTSLVSVGYIHCTLYHEFVLQFEQSFYQKKGLASVFLTVMLEKCQSFICVSCWYIETAKVMDFLEMDVKPECTVDESVCLMHKCRCIGFMKTQMQRSYL